MWESIATVVSRATLSDWLLLCFGLLLVLYIVGTWNYDYFQKRGIPSSKPKIPFLGDMATVFCGIRSFLDAMKDQYAISEGHGVFGLFTFTKPTYLVRDPELLKVVAVKEFDNFMNHWMMVTDSIFSKNVFNLKDQQWRDMRTTLSPTFTTSKIKVMFPLISQCADQMVQHLQQKCAESKGKTKEHLAIDMKNLFSRMANDVVATAAFGVTCDSLKNTENKFFNMGRSLTTFSKLRSFVFLCCLMFPKLMQALRVRALNEKAINYFDSLVQETIRERQKKNIFRPDFLQLLMQARDGNLKEDKEDLAEAEDMGAKKKLTNDEVSAQALGFFFAGFETVSTALCLTAHLLSHHPDEQEKLQAEISEVMDSTGGNPTYEDIQSLKYLDAVINESLRLYPPNVVTDRECREDTVLPAGSISGPVTIRKGDGVSVPIMGLHYDPQYWEEPEKFDPDRFSDKNKHKIKPFTYLPFGIGPRICLGQRFALIEVKLALVHLLYHFDLHPCAKTKHPLQYEKGFNLMSRGGFWCELTPREV